MGVSEVDGSFLKYEGSFKYDEATKKLSDVDVKIDTSSIDTTNKKRDNHLVKSEFFDSSKFPFMLFRSDKAIYKEGLSTKLDGYLKIKDIQKLVTLSIDLKGIKTDPWDKNKKTLFLEATTEIDRTDFELLWNKKLDDGSTLLSSKVKILLKIEAFEEGVRPAFSRFYLPTKDIKQNKGELLADIESQKIDKIVTPIDSKKRVTSNIVKETNSDKGMVYTLVFGFIIFVLLIIISIFIQLYLTKLLEKLGFSENLTFIIPSTLIIILLTITAHFVAPYMGYGTHPWQ